MELELSIGRQIAGISALSIIEWVAVRCQQKLVDRRRIGTINSRSIVCGSRRIGTTVGQVYRTIGRAV